MQIEIAEPGRMTQTGSSLRRLIQNNNMPVLDLLVRESIQNSLDARKEGAKYVEVDYLTGQFNSSALGEELELLTEPLLKRFPSQSYDYIAIRDSNTVGLTGEMDYKNVKNNVYGNLLKLVYEICKPQEAEGAGGSWGIGKTVYFRIGIGLVIYYSRIKKEDGCFESRLAASYVENETDPNAMIPVYKGMSKRGIAWWGNRVEENVTQPVTDDAYIRDFLKIFNITPYSNDETGTTIIIPFIDKEYLLTNNRIEYLNDQDQPIIPFWGHRIEDYLSIAAQRWYAPRLNNPHYQQGAFLRMKINDEGITPDSMEPVFKIIQALYNRAGYVSEEDILTNVDETKVEPIVINKYLQDRKIGILAFTKVTKDILKMNVPYNKPEPYLYFNNENRSSELNNPVLCFTRKPAMIVSYESVGEWVSNIAPSAKDEYIIGIFVLNSYNKLINGPLDTTIEEYIRKSEMADHTSWGDWSEGKYNPRFVNKIQNHVNKIISKEFAEVSEPEQPKVRSGLGKMFGDMLLPPEGFGKGGSVPPKPGSSSTPSSKRGIKFGVIVPQIKYLHGKMIVPMVLETSPKKKISSVSFDVLVDSESKKISIDEWENKMGLSTPFSIDDIRISIDVVDGKKMDIVSSFDSNEILDIDDIRFTKRCTDKDTCFGLSIASDSPHYVKMKFDITIDLYSSDVKPAFVYEKEV